MVKRVLTKIWLSVFVLAFGLFAWSNVQTVASPDLQQAESLDVLCVPGMTNYPQCRYDQEKDKDDDKENIFRETNLAEVM